MIHRIASVIALLAITTVVQAQTVTVNGTVNLQGQTTHSGVSVYFEPLTPSSRAATISSNADGSWFKGDVSIGVYNIRFTAEGYVPGLISNVFLDRDTTFTVISMRPGGSAEIGGNRFGTLSGTTVTLSGDTLYFVKSDLTLSNRTLVIEAGTELRFDKGTGLTLTNSVLDIRGTPTDSVLFTTGAAIKDLGDWKGVTVTGGTGHRIRNASFEYGTMALTMTNASDVEADGLKSRRTLLHQFPVRFHSVNGLTIRNSYFTASERPTLDLRDVSNILLEDNTFMRGQHQLILIRATGGVEIRNNAFLEYRDLAIHRHDDWGGGGDTGGGHDAGGILIENNRFETRDQNIVAIELHQYRGVVVRNNTARFLSPDNARSSMGFVYAWDGLYERNELFATAANRDQWEGGSEWMFYFRASGDILDNNVIAEYSDVIGHHRIFGNAEGDVARNSKIIGNRIRITGGAHYSASASSIEIRSFKEFRDNRIEIQARSRGGCYNSTSSFYFYDVASLENNHIVTNHNDCSWEYQSRVILHGRADRPFHVRNNTFIATGINHNNVYVDLRGDVRFEDNVILAPGGIASMGQPITAIIRNNLVLNTKTQFSNHGESRGVLVGESSLVTIANNTFIGDPIHTRSGFGIKVEGNARPRILNNHIQGYINGIVLNSEPAEVQFNNITDVTTRFSGLVTIPYIGLLSTVNHLGTPSDIYYNTSVNPGIRDPFDFLFRPFDTVSNEVKAGGPAIMYSDTFDYRLLATSPLVNAGSDRLLDPDGTRSDIGAYAFDFANPKRLRLAESVEGGFTVAFDPVDRDSVMAYRVYGGLSGQELALIQTVAKTDTAFTVTGLQNNVPYDIQMTSVFPNSESIRSMTGVFRGGVPLLKVLTPRKLVNMGTDSLVIAEYRLKNEGTRDLVVDLVPERKNIPTQRDEYFPPVFLGSNAYYLSRHQWNWHDANARATANGLQLAIIRDAGENERVRVAAGGNSVWVGAYKYNPCAFEWVDRTPLTYSNFAGGEPNNCWGERALQFYADGSWNDLVEGARLQSVAVNVGVLHRFDSSRITIRAGEVHIVYDTLKASGRVHIASRIRILSDDSSVFPDSIEVALITGVPSGLSPVYFDAVTVGTSVHSLVVTGASVDGVNLVAGDEIALYSGNKLVASASFNGTWPMLLNASGFSNDDPITAKLYLAGTKELVDLSPTITDGFETFVDEGFSVIEALGTLRIPNELVLPGNRFNLVSLFVNPPDRSLATHFSNIGTSILHDDEGSVWIPSFSINTIGTWNLERAYYLYRAGTDTVRVTLRGRPIVRTSQPIHMHGNRFNQIPMLYEQPEPVAAAFATISDRIAILQDDEGRAWIPSLGLNTIGDLLPGKGYQLFLNGASLEYTYPETSAPTKERPRNGLALAEFYAKSVIQTGLPWIVALADVPSGLPEGTELSLWDGDQIVGAGILNAGTNAITAWKADLGVELPGFTAGNRVSARLWNPAAQTEKEVRLIPVDGSDHLAFGTGAYGHAYVGDLESTGVDSDRPLQFALERVYPNPFNPTTSIQYTVSNSSHVRIEIYNSLGQLITTLVNGIQPIGRHQIVWDASSVASGIYLVRMVAGSYSSVHTVTLLK